MSMLWLVGLALAAVGGVLVGGFIHELSHYAVLRVFGRRPELIPPKYSNGRVTASVAFNTPEKVPWDIRLAAIAPGLVGLTLAAPLMVGATLLNDAIAYIGLITMLTWIAKPSRQDIKLLFGKTGRSA